MSSPSSNLGNYGYDMVVAITQASINATMNEYLDKVSQPETTLYFFSDANGEILPPVTLDQLLKIPVPKDPFQISETTTFDDPDIQALYKASFVCAIKFLPGIPPGWAAMDLDTPIVVLGQNINSVNFNMYFKIFIVIQLTPPSGRHPGSWNWYIQPSSPAKPWYMSTTASLNLEPVPNNLDTPILNNLPQQKAAIANQLSSGSYSIQQLLITLDNASLDSAPVFLGLPSGSPVEKILAASFIDVYAPAAGASDGILIAVQAVASNTDMTDFDVTSIASCVSPVIEISGQNPTSLQQQATTLNFICMSWGGSLPPISSFAWDWITPDADSLRAASGVIAISRHFFGHYISMPLIDVISPSLLTFTCTASTPDSLDCQISSAEPVDAMQRFKESGPDIFTITYSSSASDIKGENDSQFGIQVDTTYGLTLSFKPQAYVEINQALTVTVTIIQKGQKLSCKVMNRKTDDYYTMTVDTDGNLLMSSPPQTFLRIDDESPGADMVKLYPNTPTLYQDLMQVLVGLPGTSLAPVPFANCKSIVFPGANTFSFASASFSPNQDLVCSITYRKPGTNPQSSALAETQLLETSVPAPQISKVVKASQLKGSAIKDSSAVGLSSSTSMMQNYVQSNVVSTMVKFEAVQKQDAHASLVHTDGSGILQVLDEQSGQSSTGWTKKDLSSIFLGQKFPSIPLVHTFDVAQNPLDNSINLAMVLATDTQHTLAVSLSNLNSAAASGSGVATTWVDNVTWTIVPFDDKQGPSAFSISRVFFAETFDNQQYLIVDIVSSASNGNNTISRYRVSQSPTTGQQSWVPHKSPFDVEDGTYQSSIGKRDGDSVDAVYTSGTISGMPQLAYVPLINTDDPTGFAPVDPTIFTPPGIVSAMVAVRYKDPALMDQNFNNLYGFTDLYVISGSSLYCYPAFGDPTVPQLQMTNQTFSGTSDLRAMMYDNVLILWGKNSVGTVYYAYTAIDDLLQWSSATNPPSSPWKISLPLLNNMDAISTYVNANDGGNTIFAYGAGAISHLIQDSQSSSRLWRSHDIRLPAPTTQQSASFNSYTSVVHLAGSNDQPLQGETLQVTASTRLPCFVNGLYQVLSTTPVDVITDSSGNITVVEVVSGINGTLLTFSHQTGVTTTVDPQNASFTSLAALNTSTKLLGATKPSNAVAGGTRGPIQTTPLIPQTSGSPPAADDVKAVVTNLQNLQTVYSNLQNTPTQGSAHVPVKNSALPVVHVLATNAATFSVGGFWDSIESVFGDIVQCIKQTVETVVNEIVQVAASIVQDADGAWHFVANIAGQAYRAALNDVHAVVGALEWVYNRVKTGIDDLVSFLQTLFNWDNIERTKNVMYNLIKIYAKDITSDLTKVKEDFDSAISTAETNLNTWAGIKDWSPLGNTATNPVTSNSSNPVKNQTSGSQLFSHHFQNQSNNVSPANPTPTADPGTGLIGSLSTAVMNEGAVLSAVLTQFGTVAQSLFNAPDLTTVLKQIAAIFADGVLSSIQVIVDAVFDILIAVEDTLIDIVDTEIYIPIITDILEAIGISSISFLDLFCWISAVGYTVLYELAHDGNPPFPDNDATNMLINATDFSSLLPTQQNVSHTRSAVVPRTSQDLAVSSGMPKLGSSFTLPSDIYSQINGIASFSDVLNVFVHGADALCVTSDNPVSTISLIVGFISAVLPVIASRLQPKDPVQSTTMADVSVGVSIAGIAFKILCSGTFTRKLTSADPNAARIVGAQIQAYIALPKLLCSGWHFYELAAEPAGEDRTAAILGELTTVATCASTMLYCAAVSDPEPLSRGTAVGLMALADLGVAGLTMAQNIVTSTD